MQRGVVGLTTRCTLTSCPLVRQQSRAATCGSQVRLAAHRAAPPCEQSRSKLSTQAFTESKAGGPHGGPPPVAGRFLVTTFAVPSSVTTSAADGPRFWTSAL